MYHDILKCRMHFELIDNNQIARNFKNLDDLVTIGKISCCSWPKSIREFTGTPEMSEKFIRHLPVIMFSPSFSER